MAEIGSTLREARMRARIDISEVEASTKIRAKYLRALENEEWDLLLGPVYVKSFLKTYGDYLGLDSRLLIDEFRRRYERPADHEVRATAATARERDRRRPSPSRLSGALLSPRGLIGGALVAIVVALYVIGSQNGKNNPTHPITPSTNASRTSHRHHRSATGTGTSTTGTSSTATTPVLAKLATLKVVPTGTIWVCIENGGGRTLYVGEPQAGAKIPTESSKVLLVTLGSTAADVTVDGKRYTVASTPAGLRITPQGVVPLTPIPNCGE